MHFFTRGNCSGGLSTVTTYDLLVRLESVCEAMAREFFFKHACVDQLSHASSPFPVPPATTSSLSFSRGDLTQAKTISTGSLEAESGIRVFSSSSSSVAASSASSVQLTLERLQVLLGSLLMEPFTDSAESSDVVILFDSQIEAGKSEKRKP